MHTSDFLQKGIFCNKNTILILAFDPTCYKQNLEKIYPDPEEEEGETFAPFEAIVYRGAISDEQYAGPASLEEMADTIYTSR